MVEVFRTNVNQPEVAACLCLLIEQLNSNYKVNFDLNDCDRILRVVTECNDISQDPIIELLRDFGINAEVLDDSVYIDDSAALIQIKQ